MYCNNAHLGSIVTLTELNNPLFYTTGINGKALGWNTDIWAFSDLEFVDGKYVDGQRPRLRWESA